MQLAILKAGTESEIDAAFAILVQTRTGALLVGSVLTQRSTLLGAGGSKSRSRQANGANSDHWKTSCLGERLMDRKFESISLR